jgi:polysaccharide export outer membrane protein
MKARAQHTLVTVLLLLAAATWVRAAEPQTSPGYRLHAGDEILVGVFDDPKLLPQKIVIAPDGTFSFPLIGLVVAAGKTADRVRAEMEERLKKFIADPSVTVIVNDVKGNVAYVVGQVNKPGDIVMNPSVNVLQALSIAGGLNPYAKGDGIIVIRSTPAGQSVLSFHYGQVMNGKNLEQNVQLQSGDVVVVP